MAENYNLNNSFGFNIQKKLVVNGNDIKTAAKNIDEQVGNLFDNMVGYVAKYENVFNGNVERETNMYIRQSMLVGMNLRAEDNTRRNFDMNI